MMPGDFNGEDRKRLGAVETDIAVVKNEVGHLKDGVERVERDLGVIRRLIWGALVTALIATAGIWFR